MLRHILNNMLTYYKSRVASILATVETATLSTAGPAGTQARHYPCEAQGLLLYLLLPSMSDQLLNLEQNGAAVITTPSWMLRGEGRVLALTDGPDSLRLPKSAAAGGCMLVEIRPWQLQVYRENGWGFSETIDFDPVLET